MRTRTRSSPSSPYYNGSAPAIETITDSDPSASRSWKPCGHSRVSVKTLVPCIVQSGTSYNGRAPEWGNPVEAAKYLPYGSFDFVYFKGFFRDVLKESPPPVLPAFDASKVALDISRSSTNLAESIATLKDTSRMLARPGRFLKHLSNRKDIVYTERTRLAELKAAIDRAGSTWLEGTYGYIPLISDLIELSSIAVNPRKALDKLKKPVKRDYRDAAISTWAYAPNAQLDSNTARLSISTVVKASRLVRVEGQPNPTFQAMGLANQMATYLGLNDFGRLAWELIPYSFVVDWFTSMGSSLAAAAALNGPLAYCDVRFSSAIKTTKTDEYQVIGPRNTSAQMWGPYKAYIKLNGGSLVLETVDFTRSKPGEANLGGNLVVNGLNAYRTTTGVALLLGRLGSLSRW